MHLKQCVAIAYFLLQVNRKQEKRCEFFRSIFTMCKLRPWDLWRLKEGFSWMQGTKIQVSNSKTLFFANI